MKTVYLLVATIFLATACNQNSTTNNTTTSTSTSSTAITDGFDLSGYVVEDIPGSDVKWVYKEDTEGIRVEEGSLLNGKKHGMWTTYDLQGNFPTLVANFAEGKYNGPYMEYNERGYIKLKATYRNNKLHGPWGKFSFGRPETTAHYKNGELDGTYREYERKNGKLQKEINYKNGVQHGMYRFYNLDGAITLEYEYKNGEKVAGGITEEGKASGATEE